MNKKGRILFVLVIFTAIAIIFGLWYAGIYNSLISKSTAVETLYSQVDTQYQRRADLIPNLVTSTKGYLTHEQKVLIEVTQARSRYNNASTVNEKIQASNALDSAISRLLVVVEQYPNLKADATIRALMDELSGTENRINVARQRYNEGVQDYNIAIKSFPLNLIAKQHHFNEQIFFKAITGSEKAPVIGTLVD